MTCGVQVGAATRAVARCCRRTMQETGHRFRLTRRMMHARHDTMDYHQRARNRILACWRGQRQRPGRESPVDVVRTPLRPFHPEGNH